MQSLIGAVMTSPSVDLEAFLKPELHCTLEHVTSVSSHPSEQQHYHCYIKREATAPTD